MNMFSAATAAWIAWLRRVWSEILCGFNLGFICASLLLGATRLTSMIIIAGAVVQVAATALHIARTIRRKPDVPEVAP